MSSPTNSTITDCVCAHQLAARGPCRCCPRWIPGAQRPRAGPRSKLSANKLRHYCSSARRGSRVHRHTSRLVMTSTFSSRQLHKLSALGGCRREASVLPGQLFMCWSVLANERCRPRCQHRLVRSITTAFAPRARRHVSASPMPAFGGWLVGTLVPPPKAAPAARTSPSAFAHAPAPAASTAPRSPAPGCPARGGLGNG